MADDAGAISLSGEVRTEKGKDDAETKSEGEDPSTNAAALRAPSV
jgi:hypothetical protein